MKDPSERRQAIIKKLASIKQTTASELAQVFGVSSKTIYKDIAALQKKFEGHAFQIVSRPHYGIYLSGDKNEALKFSKRFAPFAELPNNDQERIHYIYNRLLHTNDFISPIRLSQDLYVSERTIERNISSLARDLQRQNIELEKNLGWGYRLKVSEAKRRNLMFQILNQYWGQSWKVAENGQQASIQFEKEPGDDHLVSGSLVQKLTDILDQFSEQQFFKFNDYEFQSLVIHLAIAISRVKEGRPLAKKLAGTDERAEQRQNAEKLTEMIKNRLGISLPPQETSYIQLHLIAATASPVQLEQKEVDQSVSELIRNELLDVGYDDKLIQGLAVHLTSTIKRLKVQISISNPYTKQIKKNYQQAFELALHLASSVEGQYGVVLNDDEAAYLALHIEAYLERTRFDRHMINAAIVCSTGQGSAQLLAAKIRNEFPQISISGIWSASELKTKDFIRIDCIISTINVEILEIPTILVSPFLTADDRHTIDNFVEQTLGSGKKDQQEFGRLIFPELTWAHSTAKSQAQVLELICQQLVAGGFAKDGVLESTLKREQISSTGFEMYALPHADPHFIKHSALAICTLEQPVKWGENEVSAVFFLAMDGTKSQQQLDHIFDYFYRVTSDQKLLQRLIKITDSQQLYQAIIGES
ncbi:BglG family transcription antiterminator [Ligilactobacillus acidipiscis]|uniref:BglG family transcription antiterminator n=1 Tax=Ligilactobacillus acidipiscis TaxID=89059 RepID=UPI0022E7CEDB|nr:BglG family transcription antiterminator [Ligilactobacillus acidipiscis]